MPGAEPAGSADEDMYPEDAVCEQTPVPLECVLQHPRHKALVADFDDISESMTRLVADYEDLERKLADKEKEVNEKETKIKEQEGLIHELQQRLRQAAAASPESMDTSP